MGLSFDERNEIEKDYFPKSKDKTTFNEEYNITKDNLKSTKNPIIWDSQKQIEIKEILKPISKKKGFSIGVALNNSLGLRQGRREENIKKYHGLRMNEKSVK